MKFVHGQSRAILNYFWVLIGLQVVVWIGVSTMELLGLSHGQRIALDTLEVIYRPSSDLFLAMIPSAWVFTGNVLLGLMSFGFGVFLYAVLGATIFWLARWMFGGAGEASTRKG